MTSKLASFLTQDGRVTARRMADAFQRQVIFGGSLDTILLEMALVDAPSLGEILSRANDMPFCDDAPDAAAEEAVKAIFSSLMVERFHAVPIGRPGGKLRVMVVDPADTQDIADLAEAIGEPVEAVIGFEYRQHQAIEKLYGTAVPKRFLTLAGKLAERARAAARQALAGAAPATVTAPAAAPVRPSLFAGRAAPAKPASLSGMSVVSSPAVAVPVATRPAPVAAPQPAPPVAAAPPPVVAAPPLAFASPVAAEPVAAPGAAGPVTAPVAVAPAVAAKPAAAPVVAAPVAIATTPRPSNPFVAARPVNAPVRTVGPAAAERLAHSFNAQSKSTTEESRTVATPPIAISQGAAAGGALIEGGGTGRSEFHDTWPFQQPVFGVDTISSGPPVFNVGPAAHRDTPLPVLTPSVMTSLDAGVPAPVVHQRSQLVVDSPGEDPAPALEVPVLSLGDGLLALQAATTRDGVFEALCRIARGRFAFATIFAVQGDCATARMALGPAFFDASALAGASVDLREPSPLRTAVQSLSPFIGRLAEDEPLGRTLAFLGRPLPAPGALLPIVIRERAVAVIIADNDARAIAHDDLAELIQATAEAGKAFLRIIKNAKKGRQPTPVSVAAVPGRHDAGLDDPAPLVTDIVSSANTVALGTAELERLLGIVEREETDGANAAARYLTGGDAAARLLASRFPGPLRFGHRKLHTIALSAVEHGPLVALAARFGERIVPHLLPRLDDASPDARFHTALVVGELGSDAASAPLGQRLFDPDVAVRRAAAFALSRFAPSATFASLLERLREALESGDLARERAAAFALGELRDATSVPKLIDKLTHRDMEVVEIAQRALVVICKQDFGTARWRWRSWWEKAKSETRAEWLLAGLEQPSTEAKRSAAEELASVTSDRFGSHARLSRREREEAARRFASWHRLHPGIFGDDRRTSQN